MPRDANTVLVGTHLYREDYEKLKELCRKDGTFHSEVLRQLIMHYIRYREKGWRLTAQGWQEPRTV